MSKLAVFRRSPVIHKRDLLLFDEFHVPNLEENLNRLTGEDLANALYLVEHEVLREANVPIEWTSAPMIAKPQMLHSKRAGLTRTLRIGDHFCDFEVHNFLGETLAVQFDLDPWSCPGIERFAAASITRDLGPLGHCTFMIDGTGGGTRNDFLPEATFSVSRLSAGPPSESLETPPKVDLANSRAMFRRGVSVRRRWRPLEDEGNVKGIDDGGWSLFEMVIQALPVPSELESLESILDFKRGNVQRDRLDRLGEWLQLKLMNGPDPHRLRIEMEGLIREHEAQMRAQRLVYRHERIRILVALPASMLRSIIASPNRDNLDFLSVLEHRALLTRTEMSSPGRDVAYVASARERFSAS